MGTWGPGIFENDAAADWVYLLEKQKDLALLDTTLDEAIAFSDEILEVETAQQALAAAEVVARLQGNWGVRNNYSQVADIWAEKMKLKPDAKLAKKAQTVIDRILVRSSEVLELWEENESSEAWQKSLKELKGRIKS
jgi:hypothetical protein